MSRFVRNPEDRYCRDVAYVISTNISSVDSNAEQLKTTTTVCLTN